MKRTTRKPAQRRPAPTPRLDRALPLSDAAAIRKLMRPLHARGSWELAEASKTSTIDAAGCCSEKLTLVLEREV